VRERDHVFDAAHQIRIADSARDQQSVVVRGVGLFDRAIDLVRVCLVEMVEPLDGS
jgi:hypothetical protein